ncbi:hypothetical protein IAT38_000103 [Cryptococcus sp. DSM 104549]
MSPMSQHDGDTYHILPIDHWPTPVPGSGGLVNAQNPRQPPYIAPGEIPQEPEVDPLASGDSELCPLRLAPDVTE